MTTNQRGCGCGGGTEGQSVGGESQGLKVRPGIVDRKVTLLIAAGAAMAANCEPCLRKIVADLKEAAVADDEIRRAVMVGQFVKEKPAGFMKATADEITGTRLSREPESDACPAEEMVPDANFKVTMLIAAGAAMAANCEFCLNKVVPDLIEAGVSETDIRRAVEIGQFVKDQPAAIMKEAADILTGSNFLDKSQVETVQQGAGCCG